MSEAINVFIGYDAREVTAFHVLSHSIHEVTDKPVSVTPIKLSQLASHFRREWDPKQSTSDDCVNTVRQQTIKCIICQVTWFAPPGSAHAGR
jgi:hypothetical protein